MSRVSKGAYSQAGDEEGTGERDMNSDFTQQQSIGGLEKAEQLSLKATVPPAQISGYEIDRLLGQGAFGQVWLGRDLNTGRQVAIKFYLYRGGVNWSLLNREVKHLVNMSTGRYIVQVLGVGWDAKPPYYVMEYLENGSLEDMVRSRGTLGIHEVVSMLSEIAEGLLYAHSKGVLHCDLKPANVMLDHDWRPRLADFGQSRMSDEQTPSLGTLFFMAPEQADLGASPDAAWDVYALGAIGYTLLVGSPPYRTPEVMETLDTAQSLPDRLQRYRETIRKAPKPRLHYARQGADKGLCQIIDRCLAPQPENRFANVQQVIEAFDLRSQARTRRPLYLLGIVGPILFLLLTLFFSARSIGVANQESLRRVQQWSMQSNQFASKFAARTLEGEIESLFRLVEAEAQNEQLRQRLLATSQSASAILRVTADGEEHRVEREQLRTLPEQAALTRHLRERLQAMIAVEGGRAGAAIFNSLFVNDAQGTNLAIEFADPQEKLAQSPVGRNFAYRSYFSGQRDDGQKTTPRDQFQPTHHTHLSASFRSTATGKWKVGISAPVWANEEDAQRAQQASEASATVQPIGVIVLTINLGDFELLAGDGGDGRQARFAVLVDGRPGNGQGTLLQHPFLELLEEKAEAEHKTSVVPQVNLQLLSRLRASPGIVDYLDPSAKFEHGQAFEGTWIAAMQQVHLPRRQAPAAAERTKSDLWVLVQERSSSVAMPVTQLVSQLQLESYIALGSLLLVMVVLWFFVFRATQSTLKGSSPLLGGQPNTAFPSTVESDS